MVIVSPFVDYERGRAMPSPAPDQEMLAASSARNRANFVTSCAPGAGGLRTRSSAAVGALALAEQHVLDEPVRSDPHRASATRAAERYLADEPSPATA